MTGLICDKKIVLEAFLIRYQNLNGIGLHVNQVLFFLSSEDQNLYNFGILIIKKPVIFKIRCFDYL